MAVAVAEHTLPLLAQLAVLAVAVVVQLAVQAVLVVLQINLLLAELVTVLAVVKVE
jgi:hypothetical protein